VVGDTASNSLHVSSWQARCTTEKINATTAISDSETGIYFLTLHPTNYTMVT